MFSEIYQLIASVVTSFRYLFENRSRQKNKYINQAAYAKNEI